MNWLKRRRIIYGCGNCRETFETAEALAAHRDPVCPLVAIEREVSAWNRRALEIIQAQGGEIETWRER